MNFRSFFLFFVALFLLISSYCTAAPVRNSRTTLSFGVHALRRTGGSIPAGEPHAVRMARLVRQQRMRRSGGLRS